MLVKYYNKYIGNNRCLLDVTNCRENWKYESEVTAMEITDAACPSVRSVVVSSDRQVALAGTDILLVLSDHLQASHPMHANSTQGCDWLSIRNTFPGFPVSCVPPLQF